MLGRELFWLPRKLLISSLVKLFGVPWVSLDLLICSKQEDLDVGESCLLASMEASHKLPRQRLFGPWVFLDFLIYVPSQGVSWFVDYSSLKRGWGIAYGAPIPVYGAVWHPNREAICKLHFPGVVQLP